MVVKLSLVSQCMHFFFHQSLLNFNLLIGMSLNIINLLTHSREGIKVFKVTWTNDKHYEIFADLKNQIASFKVVWGCGVKNYTMAGDIAILETALFHFQVIWFCNKKENLLMMCHIYLICFHHHVNFKESQILISYLFSILIIQKNSSFLGKFPK
jgi:hypothetical protein